MVFKVWEGMKSRTKQLRLTSSMVEIRGTQREGEKTLWEELHERVGNKNNKKQTT